MFELRRDFYIVDHSGLTAETVDEDRCGTWINPDTVYIANEFSGRKESTAELETDCTVAIDVSPTAGVGIDQLRWIKPWEQLPPVSGDYLVTRVAPPSPHQKYLCVARYDADAKQFIEGYHCDIFTKYNEQIDCFDAEIDITDEILAWMPWPKLYSEEESK